jgi:hypothetical protein
LRSRSATHLRVPRRIHVSATRRCNTASPEIVACPSPLLCGQREDR